MKVIALILTVTQLVTACHAGSPKLQQLPPDAVVLAFGLCRQRRLKRHS